MTHPDKQIPATVFENPGRCRFHNLRRAFDVNSGGWICLRCSAEGEPPRRSNITPTMAHQMQALGVTLDTPEVESGTDPPPSTP